jgi:hypothetical protein
VDDVDYKQQIAKNVYTRAKIRKQEAWKQRSEIENRKA